MWFCYQFDIVLETFVSVYMLVLVPFLNPFSLILFFEYVKHAYGSKLKTCKQVNSETFYSHPVHSALLPPTALR